MVPHDARRLSQDEDLDIFTLTDYQEPLIPKDERFVDGQSQSQQPSRTTTASSSSNTSSSGLFGDDLEIKPEIDTGTVSESCFSFKKLWKYTGPGELEWHFLHTYKLSSCRP